jgi:hypothetical protein
MLMDPRQFGKIKHHTIMGMANEPTREEIDEVFYSAMPYCRISDPECGKGGDPKWVPTLPGVRLDRIRSILKQRPVFICVM